MEPSWNPGGTLVEPSWNPRGTLVEPYLRAARTTPELIWAETPKLSAVGEQVRNKKERVDWATKTRSHTGRFLLRRCVVGLKVLLCSLVHCSSPEFASTCLKPFPFKPARSSAGAQQGMRECSLKPSLVVSFDGIPCFRSFLPIAPAS